jgi:hypothetical protein
MRSEDLDYLFAQRARQNSASFKRLCLASLDWQAKHVDMHVLSKIVNEAVFRPKEERRSPSFSRKAKEPSQ